MTVIYNVILYNTWEQVNKQTFAVSRAGNYV